MSKTFRWIGQYLPFLVIGLAYVWALSVVGLRMFKTEVKTDKKVIVIAHWQLETGVREGLKEAAADYEKLHPDVEIRQEAIPEGGYGQWLTIQLLGGTAPDIVEIGMIPDNLMTLFYQKYIVPVTPYITHPNPYNKGTDLENTPLYKTFIDGMRQSYVPATQEYMTISTSMMGQRLIYNKTLLKKLTGLDEAPTDFREFLAACKKIKSIKQPDGWPYTPISGSQYHLSGWNTSLFLPATYEAFHDIDLNRDGRPGNLQWALAYTTGKITLDYPSYRNSYALFKEVSQYFQPGWTGLQRNEALFKFAQQKAVFICGGLWEITGIEDLAQGNFEIGIMDFPILKTDDPEFGDLIEGTRYENPGGSVPFAVTRTSRHQDAAFDFLLFLHSRTENEKFNARLGWLPIIVGAKSSPKLEIFEPTLEGVFPALFPTLGGDAGVKWQQLLALYQVGQLSYEDMTKQYAEFYKTGGKKDFDEFLRNTARGEVPATAFAGETREKAIQSNTPQSSDEWIHYRQAALGALSSELEIVSLQKILAEPEKTRNLPLYQYSPEAWAHLRAATASSPVTAKNPQP